MAETLPDLRQEEQWLPAEIKDIHPARLTPYDRNPMVSAQELNTITTLGRIFAQSGYFRDARDEAQAIVKILYGKEYGIQPVSAMMGIHVIEGKPSFSANLMAAIIKASGRYDYRIRKLDDNGCEIQFFENGEAIGTSIFTREDARKAGLLDRRNWQQYFRNMAFSRAMSNGAKWFTPDCFGGAPVYTPEELLEAMDGGTAEKPVEMERQGEEVRTEETANEPVRERIVRKHWQSYEHRAAGQRFATLARQAGYKASNQTEWLEIICHYADRTGILPETIYDLTIEEWERLIHILRVEIEKNQTDPEEELEQEYKLASEIPSPPLPEEEPPELELK